MPKAPTSSFEAEKSVRKVSPEKWRKLGPAEPCVIFFGKVGVGVSGWE